MQDQKEKKLKVMVVDDDDNITLALKLVVSSNFPCESIDTASDGVKAWKMIQHGNYDLVLSDWNMPRMDGNQLLKLMREAPQTKEVAFLMLTVRKDVESVASAVKAGVTDYVIKPFDKPALLLRIEKLLGMKALEPVTAAYAPQPSQKPSEASPIDLKAISTKVMELLGKGEITLPAMPQVIFAIEEVLKKDEVDVKELSDVVVMDAGISSKLIGVANSVFYRGVDECTMVEEAIMRLGMQETKQLVYLISNRNLFALKDRRYEETIKNLYIHSIACGAASQSLARLTGVADGNNFFAMGLFHDIGKLLVLRVLSEITKDMHGLDLTASLGIMDSLHNKAGYMLLTKWDFQQVYPMVALNHEDISSIEKPDKELLVVYLANIFTRTLGFSLKENDGKDILETKAAKTLGMRKEMLAEMTDEVNEQVEKINNIL